MKFKKKILKFNEMVSWNDDEVNNILNIASDEGYIVNKGTTYGSEKMQGYTHAFSILEHDEGDIKNVEDFIEMCKNIKHRLELIIDMKYFFIATRHPAADFNEYYEPEKLTPTFLPSCGDVRYACCVFKY